MKSLRIAFLFLFGAGLVAAAEELPEVTVDFLDAHCFDCHDDVISEGGLNLWDLAYDSDDPVNLAKWAKVHDRVSAGEMPPEKKPRPKNQDIAKFTQILGSRLVDSWEERYASMGRVGGRRLNPVEYENTLRDLLEAPWLQLKEILPPDPEKHGFDNVAAAQEMSYVQLARYLEAAEVAIDGAMRLLPKPEPTNVRTWFSEEGRYLGRDEFEGLGTGRNRPVGDWLVILRQPNSAQAPFRIRNTSQKIPGWYRFRVRSRAVLYDHGELKAPERGQVASITTAAKRLLGRFDVPEGPDGGITEFVAWQGQDELLEFYCESLDDRDFKRDQPKSPYRGDGVAIDWFEIEGPFSSPDCEHDSNSEEWPSASYRSLFGDLAMAPWTEESGLKPPQPLNLPDLTANKRGLRETFQLPPEMMMVVSDDPLEDAERLLRDFMLRAYRRPPEESEVERCLAFAREGIGEKMCFQDAMRPAFKAALCSPDFLYLREGNGALDSFALASRLSYLFWRSQPDADLLEAAGKGLLETEEGLRAEFDRMLNDPKSERFVSDFAGQWLDLRKVHETAPDRYLFPEYFCDTHLVNSAVAETEATFAKMVHENLPARTVVDADFILINERLAELYEIDGVRGSELQKVSLPAGSPRGGFLTQSSVLKVTANGLTTSPVIRGTWILERILGIHPPAPPPDAGAIEPDTRGANSIRDLLAKHSRSESCASCHEMIDPPGFALESFDVMGAWREDYRSFGEGEKTDLVVAKRPVRYKQGLPVDASGITAEGWEFSDIHDFRQYLLEHHERQIARNLTERIATFATGAGVSFADRRTIESILDATEAEGYPVQSLLERVVFSELFRNK
ncbi:MAG: DUF1592 domain-containing protein [Verrucomicrobiota bacterium]